MRPAAVIRSLSSWWCTALLLLALAVVYLALSFGQNPYPAWTRFVFRSSAGMTIYGALIVNLVAATVRIARERLRNVPVTEDAIRSMDAHFEIALPGDSAMRVAAEWLQRHAPARDPGRGSIRRVTGSFSFLPGAVFRLGLAVLLAAVMVSVHTRTTWDTVLREGEPKEVMGIPLALDALTVDLPADHLQVGDDGAFLLENVSASISASGRTATVTPGFPARINGRYVRIAHIGYSQVLAVTLAGRRTEQTLDLDILPPGRTHILSLPSGEAFLTFSLEPDRVIAKGLVTGRQYNLREPQYRVVVQRGKSGGQAAGRTLRAGDRAEIGAAQVALGSRSRYVRVQVVSDPALPAVYGGMIVLLAGLAAMCSRFLWYEREFAALVSRNRLLIGCRDEFFKKWGMAKCQRWKEELEAALIRE